MRRSNRSRGGCVAVRGRCGVIALPANGTPEHEQAVRTTATPCPLAPVEIAPRRRAGIHAPRHRNDSPPHRVAHCPLRLAATVLSAKRGVSQCATCESEGNAEHGAAPRPEEAPRASPPTCSHSPESNCRSRRRPGRAGARSGRQHRVANRTRGAIGGPGGIAVLGTTCGRSGALASGAWLLRHEPDARFG